MVVAKLCPGSIIRSNAKTRVFDYDFVWTQQRRGSGVFARMN